MSGNEPPELRSWGGGKIPRRRRPRSREGARTFVRAVVHGIGQSGRWVVSQKRRLGWKKFLVRSAGVAVVLCILYVGFLWITLPNISDPTTLFASQSTVVTDRNGIELYRLFGEQDRTYVPGNQIADSIKNATVAIEDQRFFSHGCIEVRSIFRAVFARFIGSDVTGGASTLTQQLARNALLSRERTVTRKLKEIMLSCELERTYDKNKLLEMYLNWIPYGQNAYGVEQASHQYFGVKAADLTLAQSAVLASIPQRPTYFTPYGSHVHTTVSASALKRIRQGQVKNATELRDSDVTIGLLGATFGSGSNAVYVGGRSDQVLKNMEEQGFIKAADLQQATGDLKTMTFKPLRENIRAPYFVLWVKDQIQAFFEKNSDKGLLEQGGLTIKTTLDWNLQQAAEAAVTLHKDDYLRLYGAKNIALVALDPKTKQILAYVGNTSYTGSGNEARIDMAQTPRQPGSSFKPFVYAAAFEKGYGPATVVYDVATKIGTDTPQDFDGKFWGLMNIRQAIGASRNIPAIKGFFMAGGEEPVLDLATKMGAPTPQLMKEQYAKTKPFDYGWPLAIGAGETPLLEMVNGYSTFADAGIEKSTTSILDVRDKHGSIVPLDLPSVDDPGQQVLDPRIAYEMTSILSDASVRPTPYWQNMLSLPGFQAAAKTGTSDKCLDRNTDTNVCNNRKPDNLWTIGYTPDLVAGVWVGNANSAALSDKADGLNVAAPIWKDFMTHALAALQKEKQPLATSFPVPSGIVQPQISLLSGQLPSECTPVNERRADVFLSENAPTQSDPACVSVLVDKVTGLLASASCPVEAQEKRGFFVPHSVLSDRWPQWEQGVQDWARNAVTGTGTATLPLPLIPTQQCDISTTPGRLIKPQVHILVPANGGSATYPNFEPQITYSVGSTASGMTFLIDGKPVAQMTRPPFKTSLHMPKSVDEAAVHTLQVILTDKYFNTATDTVTFHFSKVTNLPTVRLTAPQDGQSITPGSPLTMSVMASSPSGVKYVEFYVDATLLSRAMKEPYRLIYTLPASLASGSHQIRAVVTDENGKTNVDEVSVTVGGGAVPAPQAQVPADNIGVPINFGGGQ